MFPNYSFQLYTHLMFVASISSSCALIFDYNFPFSTATRFFVSNCTTFCRISMATTLASIGGLCVGGDDVVDHQVS